MSLDDGDDEGGEDPRPDPRTAPVALDANALDRNGTRDAAVDRFMALALSGRLNLVVGEAARAEMLRADASPDARRILARAASRPRRGLSAAGHLSRIRVRAILCGNARHGKHDADALHVSEAAEADCRYFITYDSRILRKSQDLRSFAVPDLDITTLEDFLQRFEEAERADAGPQD